MEFTTLLVSIKPAHADKIFDGSKRVELRRVRPAVEKGDVLAIYVSSPNKMLRGAARVVGLVMGTPSELWTKVGSASGLTRREFMLYFEGATRGFGIRIEKPMELSSPRSLDAIRQSCPAFHPPQMYCYLDTSAVRSLGLSQVQSACAS